MKLEPTSYYVNNVVPLKDSVIEFLRLKTPEEYNASRKKCRIQGGVLSDIRYAWLCRGPKLEVIHTKTGSKVAAWSFGTVVHDFETFITCVTELPSVPGKLPVLVVGLECEIGGGMICMFDVSSSRVIRAIQIDDRVTTIHVVNPGCDASLPGALRSMDGVLAVGTGKGKVVLIDLCRQICEEAVVNVGPEYVRDEINACHLIYLSFFDLNNLEIHKERSLNSGDHLALQINDSSTSGVHFALHGPNGEVRLHANMEEVAISALHYCPQLGSLFVGFNFGAFQIYNLLNIRLEYTSPVYEDCIPITHFAIQEPCDDPRAFCYVWVAYNILENGDTGFPMTVMYALAYDTKDFLEGYGHLYQEFNSCSVRFQIELNAVPGFRLSSDKNNTCVGARCVSLNAYTKAVVNRQCGVVQDVPDDKLALCSVVWIAWNRNSSTCETYLALFDLNQWYKEQMPSVTRLEDDALSYMSCESLSELFGVSTEDGGNLLDVRLDRNTLSPFVCAQRLEEHYYPTALAFQAICIQDTNIIRLGNYGVQRHLLTQLEQAGPLRLVRPSDLFHRCMALGLTPLYTECPYSVSTPLHQQREMILSVALEHQLVRWLCCCARDWSNGSQSMAGCTLDMLLDWAWQRANTLKFQSDKLCVPLFDHAGTRLDANALLQLNHCTCQIKHLTTLFETVVFKCTHFLSEQDVDDIKYQWRALQMISIYLEVLQWLLNVGLLPECPLSMYPRPDESEKISAPYPAEALVRFYEGRRADLKSEGEKTKRLLEGPTDRGLLFIDNLIDVECNGNILRKQWQCDGGSGLYPPPSLQAVLRAYLIDDIDIVHKHCLLIYLFLDLAMTLDQSHYKPIITHLIKFPAVFKLSPSVIKITQAFWQLDHGDFSTAMTQLLDPSVNNEDLKPWHHRIVLRALLLQGQHQHALLYQQVRKPPVSSIQDICIIITLLIVNDLLQEAFHFQRYNRSYFNETEILKHFFTICDRMNHQASVLHLPLCAIEEREFISYLKSHPTENNKNFLVIYYLQRDRYGEAFQINDYLNSHEIAKQGLIGQQDKNFRDAIVSGFKKTLPAVTQQLLDYCKNEKDKICSANVSRPVPMSVCVHDTKRQTKYKSTLIQASFQKAKELWSTKLESPDLNDTPFISTPKIFRFSSERKDSSIIYPAILDSSNMELYDDLDEGATPAKRIKLSPRRSINTSTSSTNQNRSLDQFKKRLSCYNSDSLLGTPIVKRRSLRNVSINNEQFEGSVLGTPPSILKVRPFLRNTISPDNKLRETSTTPETLEDTPATKVKKRTSFGITPRKPILRTPRPAVHFEERSSSRSSIESGQGDHSDHFNNVQTQIDVHREATPDKSTIDSKNSSRSTDDLFYSPNSSLNASDNTSTNQEQPQLIEATADISNPINESSPRSSLKRKANDSVSSRRSYKPSTPLKPLENIQNTSVRESLKSRRSIANVEPEASASKETSISIVVTEASDDQTAEEIPGFIQSTKISTPQQQPTSTRLKSRSSLKSAATPEASTQKTESPKIVPKISGRRSLSRQVLENNLLSKVVATPTPRVTTRLSLAQLTDSDKKRGVQVSYTKSTTSIVKTMSDEKIEETCDIKVIEKTDEFSSEKNDAASPQIIKHVHNETETKSNVTKVTEFLDDKETTEDNGKASHLEEMNVLSFNSDISENEASHFYKGSPESEKRYSVLLSTPDSDNTQKSDVNEEMEVVDDQEKQSGQSEGDDDKMEENKEAETNSHDDKETEALDVEIDETSEEEINIYDDLVQDVPQENQHYESNSESEVDIEEAVVGGDDSQPSSSSSSSEDSSQTSDVILIKSSSDEGNSNQSSSSSVKLLQNDDDDDEDGDDEIDVDEDVVEDIDEDVIEDIDENVEDECENNEQSDENIIAEIKDFDESSEIEAINEDSDESNIPSEENFKLTLDEDEEEQMENEQNNSILEQLVEEENVDKETKNKAVQESNEEENAEKEEHAEMMEDINEDNMDKNNEFFINEDIEEMENVEFITEKSNDAAKQTNTAVTEIHEEIQDKVGTQEDAQELFGTHGHGKEANAVELLESVVADEKSEDASIVETEETTHPGPLETNVIEITETTIKSSENEDSCAQNAEMESSANPLEQNIIEISDATIKLHEIEESTIEIEEIMDMSSNPLEENVIEISETTINLPENEESTIQDEEITVNPLEQNVIEISETTIKPSDIEESIIQIEDITIEPHEKNVLETTSKQKSPESNETQTPARRTRSASQHSETKNPETPTRSSTRRRSVDHKIEEQKPTQRITKKRSVSVDDKPSSKETAKPRTRKTSTDETPKKTRASSVVNLQVIEENKPLGRTRRAASVDLTPENKRQQRGQSLEPETRTTAKRGRKRTLHVDAVQDDLQSIPEQIEEYSATHRLTRHQKSIMEKSLVVQQKSRLEKLKEVEQIDPIKLLDKKSFTGSPDKEEKTYRAISPASSISTQSSAAVVEHMSPSTPKRKRGRPPLSATPGSSTNTDNKSADPDTPSRPRRRSFTQAQQAMAATTPTRARRSSRTTSQDQEDAASVVSVSSVMSVPVLQLKQFVDQDFVRHRSLSPTALKEETSTVKNRRRSTRSSVLPTNLSKISEETNSETKEEKPRRGRHRKTETEGTSSQSELTSKESSLKKTSRRSSYKPLVNYLPEHSVIKTRKSFKIRKFSRDASPPP